MDHLESIIEKNQKNYITLTMLLIMLENFIQSMNNKNTYHGLCLNEIAEEFLSCRHQFNQKKVFSASYVHRHCKENGFLSSNNNRYVLNAELIQNRTEAELISLKTKIFDLLAFETNLLVETAIEIEHLMLENNRLKSYKYLLESIESTDFKKCRQLFEIISYAILKVYFENFGFGLKRFSTTFTNDGGMDFISNFGFFSISVQKADKKLKRLLADNPGVIKVLVTDNLNERQKISLLSNSDLTEIISIDDLKNHFLNRIYNMDRYKPLLIRILETMQSEFHREM